MSKIGRWHNIERMLPVPTKTVLLDLGDDVYIVSRLYSIEESERKILFAADSMHDPRITNAEDVVRWAYIKLDGY